MAMEYFCCFHAYRKKLESLSDSEKGRLWDALMIYSETGERAKLNGREAIAFDFIAADIDAAKEKYAQKCRTNKQNREKGTSTTVDDRARPSTNSDETHQTKNKKQKENIYTTTAAASACAGEPFADSLHDDDLAACIVCYEENIGSIPRYVSEAIAG